MSLPKDTYRTVTAPSPEIPVYKEKGSKFFGYAFHVEQDEQIRQLLANLRNEHHAARHVCYAYRLGADGSVARANDDGEPSGTAGWPIQNQLLSFDVTDTLVAIVRYFGGILLGTSGLITAYRQAARLALETARIEERVVEQAFELRFGYPQMSAVMRLVKERGLRILEQDFREKCHLRLSARLSTAQGAKAAFSEIFGVALREDEGV